ncbi:MAG: UTRA domain-containing protein [Parvularculaceae bacterium]
MRLKTAGSTSRRRLGIADAPLDKISANEWLIRHAPYSSGDVSFSAEAADAQKAKALEIDAGAPLFTVERATWLDDMRITYMRLYYPPGYRMRAQL